MFQVLIILLLNLQCVLVASMVRGLSGLLTSELMPPSTLLGLAELAIENTPESAWLAGESLLFVSRGDSAKKKELLIEQPFYYTPKHEYETVEQKKLNSYIFFSLVNILNKKIKC